MLLGELEGELAFLYEGLDALGFILGSLEGEAFPKSDCEALILCRGIPNYLASLRTVARDLRGRADAMQSVIKSTYSAKRAG